MQIHHQHQYPETPSGSKKAEADKTTSNSEDTAVPAAGAETPETAENAENTPAYTPDEATTSPPAESHEQPANQVNFGDVPPESSATASSERPPSAARQEPLHQLQRLFKEKRPVADPAVMKLLEYVREMQDKNVQHMLDMMQESLDRAREMMEKNQEIYYSETLPKLESIQALIQQEQGREAAAQTQIQTDEVAKIDSAQNRSDRTVAHKLQHLTREVQKMTDHGVPPDYASLQMELQQALQLALVL